MNMPALRFTGFIDIWASKKLDEITSYVDYRGKTPEKSDDGVFLVTAKNIRQGYIDYVTSREFIPIKNYEEVMRRGKPLIGDVLITTEAPLGYVASVDREDIALAQRVIKLRGLQGVIQNGFLKFYLVSERFQKELFEKATGGTVKGIKGSVLHKMKVHFPTLSEQTKIANFLTAVDEKISQLTQKHDLLNQYKKGVMQQIFSQELRFKDDDGRDFPEWEEVLLKDIAERVKTKNKEDNKNVLTISAQQGLINQEEYFNKSVAAKDLTNYYLLHKGDFAYNKSYSNGYPMGAIKCLNRYEKGVVSTLYICFKFHDGYVNTFFEHYFETGLHNKEIEKVAQEGARNHGLLNIGLDDFFSILLTIPVKEEQAKIANFLTAIDDKITAIKAQMDAVKQYKQGLLQQMFV